MNQNICFLLDNMEGELIKGEFCLPMARYYKKY